MKIQDYPPQEALSPVGQKYQEEVMRRYPQQAGIELSYGPDPYQGLLLFPAAVPNGNVLLFFHGGGWTSGYKEWMAFMAPALTRAGVTFAAAGYRLAPGHLFAESFQDCCRAVARCVAEAPALGGDAARLFIGGHSAGGHFAALMAVRRDWQAGLGLRTNVVRGCLPLSGTYWFGEGAGLSMRPRFLGPGDAPDADEIARAASPLYSMQGVPPAFLVSAGSLDFPHLMTQADTFVHALREAGGQVKRLVLDGCDHFGASYAAGDPEGVWVSTALTWMAAQASAPDALLST